MKFVFEDCPVTSYQKVQKLLRLQLGISINSTFINFDRRPIASATIAQVHIGIMKESNKRIAIKIQHPGESLLHNDIGNMLFISQIMECVGLKPPFDHKNVLLEYARQVFI
jgi:predicted unusual protein kinase regulating ubiquinone biosynthesis (AarF/ABC1/UbiB family)